MTEAYTAVEKVMKYYGKIEENGNVVDYAAQIPFNFILTDSNITTTAFDFKKLINTYMGNLPKGEQVQANWVVSILFEILILQFSGEIQSIAFFCFRLEVMIKHELLQDSRQDGWTYLIFC